MVFGRVLVSSAADYERAGAIADFAIRLSNLTHELALERDLSVRFVAEGRRNANTRTAMRNQQAVVNKAAGEVQAKVDSVEQISQGSSGGQRIHDEIAQVRTRLRELTSMRQVVANTQMLARPAMDMYSRTIADLLAIHDEISRGAPDEALAANASAYAALTRAKEQASRERASLAIGLASRRFTPEGLDTFIAARAQRDSELATFRAEASVAQRQFFDDTLSSQKNDRAASIRALLAGRRGARAGRPRRDQSAGDQSRWFEATTDASNGCARSRARSAGRSSSSQPDAPGGGAERRAGRGGRQRHPAAAGPGHHRR